MNSDLRILIEHFGMERHHIAGWFSHHYGDSSILGRPRLSSIYYLLPGDEDVPLHKVDGIEVWHYYKGAPAEFTVTNSDRMREVSVLGCDFADGQRPQLAVPAFSWQIYRSLGDWTLLGCTMSPGYLPRTIFVLDATD